jgi:hypothetical protein
MELEQPLQILRRTSKRGFLSSAKNSGKCCDTLRLGFFCAGAWLLSLSIFAHSSFDLDIDDDGKTEALTDGLLVIRHLFGFSGDSLTTNATGADAQRSDAVSIETHLVDNKSSLDVDGDGNVEALTDGLLIIRELFEFSGDSLITGAVSETGTRLTGDSVAEYLKTIKDTDNDGTLDSSDTFPNDPYDGSAIPRLELESLQMSLVEGTTYAGRIIATDPLGGSLSFSLLDKGDYSSSPECSNGNWNSNCYDDINLFSISLNGAIDFITAPDFESKKDYRVGVGVSNELLSTTSFVDISVSNYALSLDAKETLVSLGYNVPSTTDHSSRCIVGLDVPTDLKDFCTEVYGLLHTTLGGYPNYLHVIWNEEGTEADAKPVLEKLNAVKAGGSRTLALSDLNPSCLSGHDAGRSRTATTNPYSVCYETLAFTSDPFGGSDTVFNNKIKLALHYAHEYFHHYQRVHGLERGFDYQSDRDNPSTTVQAPTWWIEPAAVAFQNIWFQTNYAGLEVFKDSRLEDVTGISIASETSDWKYKSVRRALLGSDGSKDERCASDWQLSNLDETYDTWSQCGGVGLAVPYLAHLTSWKTVWVDLPVHYYDLGFWGALEKLTGLTRDQFYSNFNTFIRSGNAEDDPPAGWAPTSADLAEADFLNIKYEKL